MPNRWRATVPVARQRVSKHAARRCNSGVQPPRPRADRAALQGTAVMRKDTGGTAFPCGRCDTPSVIRQGHQWLCAKHYRFGQMLANAKRRNKQVPTHDQLHQMLGADLICPDCGVQMNWRSKDGAHTVATLQHYRDGSMAIVCLSCNTRHASMEGDSYREMPKDHKQCPGCKQIKPLSEFTLDASRSGPAKRKSKCRQCADMAVTEWKGKNRERYNEYQRKYREKRKAEGNPVRGGA